MYVPWESFGTKTSAEQSYNEFSCDVVETTISRALSNQQLKDEDLELLLLFPVYKTIADIELLTEELLIKDPDNEYANALRLIELYKDDDLEYCLPQERYDIEEAYKLVENANEDDSFILFVRGYYYQIIHNDYDSARRLYQAAATRGSRQAKYQLWKLGDRDMLRESLRKPCDDEPLFIEFPHIIQLVIELHKQLGKQYNPLEA